MSSYYLQYNVTPRLLASGVMIGPADPALQGLPKFYPSDSQWTKNYRWDSKVDLAMAEGQKFMGPEKRQS